MKIVVAPDKFKGSLPATRVAAAIAAGLHAGRPGAEVVTIPVADGGEGTVDATRRRAERAENAAYHADAQRRRSESLRGGGLSGRTFGAVRAVAERADSACVSASTFSSPRIRSALSLKI